MENIFCDNNSVGIESEDSSSGDKGMRKIYRVETFIIPRKVNNNNIFRSTEELDLNYLNCDDEKDEKENINAEESIPGIFEENSTAEMMPEIKESVSKIERQSLDEKSRGHEPEEKFEWNDDRAGENSLVGFDCSLQFRGEGLASPNIERSQSYDFLPYSKPGSDLKSIKESCEVSYGSCEELCHHGNKNGCTVAAQSPSQVSEEIFKENWMQRLEFLRRRVSLIRDKEVALQERERVLLKKEKELRILERLAKEKIQRADLYLKRCTIRNSTNLEDDLTQNLFLYDLNRPSPPPYPEKPQHVHIDENNHDPDSREILSAGSRTSIRSKESSGNSTRSGSSRGGEKDLRQIKDAGKTTSTKINCNQKSLEITKSVEGSKDFRRSKWSAYSSWRCRSKPKMSYDDLDSTLSADIGDSSFAITSKKLDPRLVRKPRGFSRSASERGPKTRPCSLDLDVDFGPDGERVLRKISENILSAVTESQGTKFQNYGLIDVKKHKSEPKIDDLVQEKIPPQYFENNNNNKNNYRPDLAKDQVKSRKERTTNFWNEEASDWLRKKRQAYNLATKRMANRDYENKENFGNSKTLQHQITEKQSKTKNEKGKKFTIFR